MFDAFRTPLLFGSATAWLIVIAALGTAILLSIRGDRQRWQ